MNPSFPFGPCVGAGGHVHRWLGGDGGKVVRLAPGRLAALFSDTFVGPPRAAWRGPFVANTVATFGPGEVPRYWCGGGPGGAPGPIFTDPYRPPAGEPATRFWAGAALMAGGRLYVALNRIQATTPQFTSVTSLVARVNNPLAPPPHWHADYLDLHLAGWPMFGAELVAIGGDVCIFGVTDPDPVKADICALKVPLAALEAAPAVGGNVGRAASYLAADGTWKPGTSGPDAMPIGRWAEAEESGTWGCNSGFSIALAGNQWRAVLTNQKEDFPRYGGGGRNPSSGWAVATVAPTPFGPWRKPRPLYRFPEFDPASPLYRPGIGGPAAAIVCYALAQAPASAAPGKVRFTYCNDSGYSGNLGDLDFYRIKAVEAADPFA